MKLSQAIADVQRDALALRATTAKTLILFDALNRIEKAYFDNINQSLEGCADSLKRIREAASA